MDLNRIYRNFEEHPEPTELPVKGTVPSWLHGVLLRVGPAIYDLPGGFTVNHWFDGMAMLHNFVIGNGKVVYRSKYLQSDAYQKAMQYQRPIYNEFGTRGFPDICKNVFSRLMSHFVIPDLTDNDMVNVYRAQDSIFSATEGHFIHTIDPITLDTMERVNLAKLVSVNLSTAHPHFDPDGTMYNLGTSFTSVKYHIVKFPPSSAERWKVRPDDPHALSGGSIVCQVPFSSKTYFTYYHSFAMTTNYVIFLEQPLLVNIFKLIAGRTKGRSLKECLEWLPEEHTRFHVIDKRTGVLVKTKYHSKAFFTFHHINAYEQENHLIVDLIAYPSADVVDQLYLSNLRLTDFKCTCLPQTKRFVLPIFYNIKDVKMDTNLVRLAHHQATAWRKKESKNFVFLESEDIGPLGLELPQINYGRYNGQTYRYFYATGLIHEGDFQNSVAKMDMQTKQYLRWKGCDKTIVGEPVFVPHPDAQDEDDGMVLAIVLKLMDEQPDFLLILDAKTMTEVARAEFPTFPLAPLLHGTFFTPDTLQATAKSSSLKELL